MAKTLGFTLALLLTLTLSAGAEMAKGTVKSIDATQHTFMLEDGTTLSVSDQYLGDLSAGDKVEAVYQVQGGQKVVTDLERRTMGVEKQETTNFGSRTRENIDWDSID